jgi:hypothetical protein
LADVAVAHRLEAQIRRLIAVVALTYRSGVTGTGPVLDGGE